MRKNSVKETFRLIYLPQLYTKPKSIIWFVTPYDSDFIIKFSEDILYIHPWTCEIDIMKSNASHFHWNVFFQPKMYAEKLWFLTFQLSPVYPCSIFQDEEVEERAKSMLPGSVLTQLANANWKERLAGMEEFTTVSWVDSHM